MDKSITYRSTRGSEHSIDFYDLLTEGHNMDTHIINGTLFRRPDHQFKMLVDLLKPSSIVYDVGAYIGTFSIPMAIENMKLYAFEGFPDNHIRCKKNTAPYNVINHSCAVSNKQQIVESKFNNCMAKGNDEIATINYVVFDDYITENSLPEPDLVKVDIEGMETLALHGMTNLIENVRPIWQMGYHFKFYSTVEGYPGWVDVEDGGYDFQNFDRLGYLIFDESGRRCDPTILDHRGGEFVFIPKEKIKRK